MSNTMLSALEEGTNLSMQEQVNVWRRKFKMPINDTPTVLDPVAGAKHIDMIRREFEEEFVPAVLEGDLVESYDAGLDLLVYLLGWFAEAGLDADPGFHEVMASNFSKLDPVTKEAIFAVEGDGSGETVGKVLKGPDYWKPNLRDILLAQGADV